MNREAILSKIAKLKTEPALILPLAQGACLEAVTASILEDYSGLELMTRWRDAHQYAFPAQFKVTLEGTRRWAEKALLAAPERLLFWVIDSTGKRIGHVGLFRLSEAYQSIEIDNILRGEESADKNLMSLAIKCLLTWQREQLEIPVSYLRVFLDNERAIRFYNKLNYVEVQRVPLFQKIEEASTSWVEIKDDFYKPALNYFVTMRQKTS